MGKRIRLDLFLCMLLVCALYAGLWFVADKFDIIEKATNAFVGVLEPDAVVTDNGEVGGYPLADTPCVTNLEELSQYAQCFTMEMSVTRYLNNGSINGGEYFWRILRIDNALIAARINENALQKDEEEKNYLLPVGKVVMEEPEIIEDMKRRYEGGSYLVITNAYIDMDGEANSTYVSPLGQSAMLGAFVCAGLIGLFLFVLYIVLVFAVHAVFCKLGIFPPLFRKRT